MEMDIDEADVLVLSQGLEKSSRLTFEINKSLKKIATTSNQSSQLFTPILSRNNMLITLQRNIESVLNSVASVKDLANEASKYEIILLKGIQEIGLKQYIQVIHKLDDMLEDIRTSGNETNSEFHGILTHLSELITLSETELRSYFVSILNSISPFDPQICINKKQPFPYYEDEQLNEMASILDYFHNNSDDSNIQDVFIAARSDLISKSMAFLEPFAKYAINSSNKNAHYEKNSSGMISYTEALLGFIANEKSLVNDLYSQYTKYKPIVINSIITPLINSYCKIFNSNMKSIRNDLDNMGLFSFELVENIHNVIKSLKMNHDLYENETLMDCANQVHKVTQSLFKDAIDRIATKVNQLNSIPSDNGVTEPTVDTMSRLRKFSEYKNGCLGAMENMSRENWLPMNYKEKEYTFNGNLNSNDQLALMSCFVSDCIDTLVICLERKIQKILMPNQEPDVANPNSPRNKQKQRVGFCILMNMSLVEQIIEKSELNSMLGKEGHIRMEKLKKRYISYLVSDWRDLTANLMDSVFIDSTGKKSKDKEQIKEKFKKFNEGFEELVSKSKQYRLSDPALKKVLKSEIISLVMPMYERFYNRYKDSFKNPRKHIKYTPDELMNVLTQLVR
ncbi:GTP-Rho binding exocyst subunit EXO70 NDAI_0G05560 [Naumovozyma dairenensis CBS 421]|uniref:Exocyst complex protein EXO70 n=1 Tax=Naumovozyma dairenensis (strain ATCC 10597 / BCRC 20456 / CBS 421 / NBRC 0211 / NRRL Y-12639) TaxID=1071378 RepID=J7REJ7_NAUDC|nr:hypothetical protein NDAI_0G05560 [Naumovozyma dairenensis CBS 421]CCK73539.1 hypothetical protein NDAI_0G05560 [Naumovozyma dairenensis CBS 421]